MQIKIKRIDKTLPLPEYKTPGAVAFDLYSRLSLKIKAKTTEKIPTNIIVETPKGYLLEIKDRSSTLVKKGLLCTVGYIDQDYCGENDEILLQVYNIGDSETIIEKGERIGQGVFIKINKAEWLETEQMNKTSRGGFGTTN